MRWFGKTYYGVCRTGLGRVAARAPVRLLRALGFRRSFFMPFDALDLPGRAAGGLMKLWSRIHWSGEDGMMPPDQLLAVYRFAATWPGRGDVVELGTWTGLTTCYLGAACQVHGAGRVYTVDTFRGTKEGGATYDAVRRYGGSTWHACLERIHQADLDDVITPLVGDTAETARVYDGRPIRVLLIDADHSHAGVQRDFHAWFPHVAPGGLILFHDYAMPEAGVKRFVDELVSERHDDVTSLGVFAQNVAAVVKRLDLAPAASGSSRADPQAEGLITGLRVARAMDWPVAHAPGSARVDPASEPIEASSGLVGTESSRRVSHVRTET